MGKADHVDSPRTGQASPLKGVSRPLLDGRFLQITSLTRGRARFQYAQPKVVRPVGSTFENEETPINKISTPNIRMHFDRAINEQPIVTTYSLLLDDGGRRDRKSHHTYRRQELLAGGGPASRRRSGQSSSGGRVQSGAMCGIDVGGYGPAGNTKCADFGRRSGLSARNWNVSSSASREGSRRQRRDQRTEYYSAFSADRADRAVTWGRFDMGVISMLFDSDLRSGMTAAEILPVARRLVPKYFQGQYRP